MLFWFGKNEKWIFLSFKFVLWKMENRLRYVAVIYFIFPFSFRIWINFKIMDRIKEIKILGKCMCKIFFHNKFHFHLQRMNNQLSIGCGLFLIKDLNITIIPIKYTKPYLAVNNISLFFLTILKAFLITNWGPAKIIFHKFFFFQFSIMLSTNLTFILN